MSELLEKAKKVQQKKGSMASKHDPDLALAWLSGDVALGQVKGAIGGGIGGGQPYIWLAMSLRKAYRQGRIKIA